MADALAPINRIDTRHNVCIASHIIARTTISGLPQTSAHQWKRGKQCPTLQPGNGRFYGGAEAEPPSDMAINNAADMPSMPAIYTHTPAGTGAGRKSGAFEIA